MDADGGESAGTETVREPAPWPELVAAFVVLVVVFAWYWTHLAPGITFGRWQGPQLQSRPLYPVPLVSYMAAQWAAAIDYGRLPWRLNLLSALCGALAAASLAATTAGVLRRIVAWLPAIAGGVLAGCAFAAAPVLHYLATAAGPATMTLLMVWLGLACFVSGMDLAKPSLRFIAAGLTIGLAAANDPAMGVVFILIFLWAVATAPITAKTTERLLGLVVAFLFGASLPVFEAMQNGETISEFFFHALRTPYPALGGATPEYRFGEKIFGAIPLMMLVLAGTGGALLFIRSTRSRTLLIASVLLGMGPLLPWLTNRYGRLTGLSDPAAPYTVALGCVCLLAGAGAVLVGTLLSHAAARRLQVAIPLCTTAIVAGLLISQWPPFPDRQHNAAEDLGFALYDQYRNSLPENALPILVTGDPFIYSLLSAVQHEYPSTTNVTVIPAAALSHPLRRTQLREGLDPRINLSEEFPTEADFEWWRFELPRQLSDAVQRWEKRPTPSDLEPFAMWALVSENLDAGPVGFVAANPSWLFPRGQAADGVLLYPGNAYYGEAVTASISANTLSEAIPENVLGSDPMARQTLAALLNPLIHAAYNQDQAGAGAALGKRLLELITPEDDRRVLPYASDRRLLRFQNASMAYLAAQARQGSQKVIDETGQHWWKSPGIGADAELKALRHLYVGEFTGQLQALLQRHDLEQMLHAQVQMERAEGPDPKGRETIFRPLWEAEEFVLLGRAYERLLLSYPDDGDALYQLAAVQAQLGLWEATRESLATWIEAAGVDEEQATDHLASDPRFSLFRRYRMDKTGALHLLPARISQAF